MKSLRQLCATLALTFVLATAAFAEGTIYPGYTPPPPPPPAPSTTGIIYPGVASPRGELTNEGAQVDSATEFMLNLIEHIITLF